MPVSRTRYAALSLSCFISHYRGVGVSHRCRNSFSLSTLHFASLFLLPSRSTRLCGVHVEHNVGECATSSLYGIHPRMHAQAQRRMCAAPKVEKRFFREIVPSLSFCSPLSNLLLHSPSLRIVNGLAHPALSVSCSRCVALVRLGCDGTPPLPFSAFSASSFCVYTFSLERQHQPTKQTNQFCSCCLSRC